MWDSVDNRLGQLVYDNLFWQKTLKDSLMLGTRSLGWNLGTVRELGGGVADIVNMARGGEFTHRAAYAMALPMVTGIMGAVTTYLYTGHGPKSLQDYINPPTGKFDADGNEQRLQLPTYMKDVVAWSTHPVDTAVAKLSPMHSAVVQMLNNRDYYGNQIRNPDDPIIKQVGQEAAFIAKQFIPFSVRGAMQQKQRGEGMKTQAASFFGINPAPQSATQTPMMAHIHAHNAGFQAATRTPEEAAKHEAKSQVMDLHEKGQPIPAELANKFAPQELEDLKKQAAIGKTVCAFKPLPLAVAIKAAKLATDAEWEKVKPVLEKKHANQAQKFMAGRITKEDWEKQHSDYQDLLRSKGETQIPAAATPSPTPKAPVPKAAEPKQAATPLASNPAEKPKGHWSYTNPKTGEVTHRKENRFWVAESEDGGWHYVNDDGEEVLREDYEDSEFVAEGYIPPVDAPLCMRLQRFIQK